MKRAREAQLPYEMMTLHQFQVSDRSAERPLAIGDEPIFVLPYILAGIRINDAHSTLVSVANKFQPPARGTVLVIGDLVRFEAVAAMAILERRWFALNMGDQRLLSSLEQYHCQCLDAMACAVNRGGSNDLTRACEDRRIRLPEKVQLVRDFIETGNWETAEEALSHTSPSKGRGERS